MTRAVPSDRGGALHASYSAEFDIAIESPELVSPQWLRLDPGCGGQRDGDHDLPGCGYLDRPRGQIDHLAADNTGRLDRAA